MSDDHRIVDAEDLFELMSYIGEHADHIYMRARVGNRKWESVSLSAMNGKDAVDAVLLFITRWFTEPGYRPARLRTEEEMAADKEKA